MPFPVFIFKNVKILEYSVNSGYRIELTIRHFFGF